MPRKAKENEETKKVEKKTTTKKSTTTKKASKTSTTAAKTTKATKKTSSATAKTTQSAKAEKETKAATSKKAEKKTTAKSTKKSATTTAKAKKASTATSKKESKTSTAVAKTTKATKTKKEEKAAINKKEEKKTPAKSTKKSDKTATKATKKKIQPKTPIIEYYDLPDKYNETVVKVLAQTPKTLFVYWEISDADIEKYKEQYGDNFFETTKPVLIIHNETLNYSFEVDINDFANCWYLHINDSKSDYKVELGRRPIINNEKIKSDYIYITSSNGIESPNDHILFNTDENMVYFRNVKTNQVSTKNISSISFMRNMGKIYNIYDLYKEIYKDEDNLESLSNPSS